LLRLTAFIHITGPWKEFCVEGGGCMVGCKRGGDTTSI
jgi:hypothetical protein